MATITSAATINTGNQLTTVTNGGTTATWTYDKNGNLLSDGTRTYSWDAENRLISVTVTATKQTSAFAYDGLSRRTSITDNGTETRYLWCGEQICAARTKTGTTTARFFAQGETGINGNRYYAKDRLGSITTLMDNTGTSKGTATYDAYGRTTLTGETPSFAYAGMFYHGASGLYLTHYRAYNPDAGRWISRDPIGEQGGMNLYGYAGGDPMNGIDPAGLQTLIIVGGPSGYNVFGHVAIATSGSGIYSFGTGTALGSSVSDYLLKQASYRDSTVYIINTTSDQEANIISNLQSYPNQLPQVPGPNSSDTCASRTGNALEAGGMPPYDPYQGTFMDDPAYNVPSPFPNDVGSTADSYVKSYGGSEIYIPQGTTALPSTLNQFNSR